LVDDNRFASAALSSMVSIEMMFDPGVSERVLKESRLDAASNASEIRIPFRSGPLF